MADSAGINSIIARAVALLCSDSLYAPRMTNCWLPAATWAKPFTQSGQIFDPSLGSIGLTLQCPSQAYLVGQ